MTLDEIKAAVEEGHKVHWSNEGYEVIKDNLEQWLIKRSDSDYCIGLTWRDGVTMNGKPEDFFVGHVWGPFERARLTGNAHRKCQVPGCREITLDGDDEE